MLRIIAVFCLLVAGCGHVGYVNLNHPAAADDQRRIWVVHEGELLRCADGATGTEPPKPLCVRALKAN